MVQDPQRKPLACRVSPSLPALVALLTVCAPGCALFTKADPLRPRYFSPTWDASSEGPTAPAAGGGCARLELGRVRASAHLRERIAFRLSDSELGFYEGRRWTERPADYLRRATARALFEQRGVARAYHGRAPILELELTAFEEVRGAAPVGRVEVIYRAFSGPAPGVQGTVRRQVSIPKHADDPAAATVQALTRALAQAVARVADAAVDYVEGNATGSPGCQE